MFNLQDTATGKFKKMNLFVGKTNVKMKIMCFDGWNRRGLITHISRMMDLRSGLFDIYFDADYSPYRSVFS
jgi:hypothetical protein